jgi:hypothetical protein
MGPLGSFMPALCLLGCVCVGVVWVLSPGVHSLSKAPARHKHQHPAPTRTSRLTFSQRGLLSTCFRAGNCVTLETTTTHLLR